MTGQNASSANGASRFDLAALRAKAGVEVFARGQEYASDGSVEIIAVEAQRVVARVVGNSTYRAELTGSGSDFSGFCSCPAYPEWGFCKHLVATALMANADGGAALDASEALVARIRVHLRAQGLEALIERIIVLSERDPALREALALEATVDAADDDDVLARFEQAIAAATEIDDYVSYAEAADWAEGIAGVLDGIDRLIDGGRAALALRLLNGVLERMDETLERVDDSDGAADGLIERACQMHLKACIAARPDPLDLARSLFTRGLDSDTFAFTDASVAYADVLGEGGRAEYRRLVCAAWNELGPVREGREVGGRELDRRYRLSAMLDDLAEHDGDIDTRIAIRAKNLVAPDRYVDIAELCLDGGRKSEAVTWVEEGLRRFEERPDARLVAFAADLYRGLGRGQEADALLWRQFERDPDRACYDRLRQQAGKDAGAAAAIVDRAVASLEARLLAAQQERPSTAWRAAFPADLLIDVLVSELRMDAAWEVARNHRCNEWTMRALAEASESSHPAQALEFYATLVERQIGQVSRPGYERACSLIRRMADIRGRLGEGAAHAAYLAELSRRHKAKRNFMTLLRSQDLAAAANTGKDPQ